MTLETLLAAAERACAAHNDSDAARAQMRADCIAVPTDQRADLHAHFIATYESMSAKEA